jgi:hypothetical protein
MMTASSVGEGKKWVVNNAEVAATAYMLFEVLAFSFALISCRNTRLEEQAKRRTDSRQSNEARLRTGSPEELLS